MRDKEGAKQDLQNHALAYKRRELQVGNFRFLCTSCDDAMRCQSLQHPPSDFAQQGHTDADVSCFLSAERCHAVIHPCAASLKVLFAGMSDSKEDSNKDSKKDCQHIQLGTKNEPCSKII